MQDVWALDGVGLGAETGAGTGAGSGAAAGAGKLNQCWVLRCGTYGVFASAVRPARCLYYPSQCGISRLYGYGVLGTVEVTRQL